MKILLAIDGSAQSENAVRFLLKFNFSHNDEIMVLNVISHVPFKDDRESYYARLKQIKQEIGPQILDSAINILKPLNTKISTALLDGYPDRIILEAASEFGADLIVMGARGLKGIKSLMVGSVTRSVSINSQMPVLVVKSSQLETTDTLKVVYATDGSNFSINTGKFLSKIPFNDDAEITIINVIPSAYMDIPERYWMEVDEKIKDEIAKIREIEFKVADKIIEDAREVLRSRFSKIKVSIKFGDPSLEILNEAEQSMTDIIAVGSSGMRGVKGMLGSVSRSILGHAKCSVLIGK
ncbi:universal stress protein [hot springs metagenome]|uniref:Universal stress protein n=1 Tax=hot springs metagenome TaxID=433727 RepID=A0A5J4L9M8_9ZZZZ